MEIVKSLLGGAGGAALIAGLFTMCQWFLNRKAAKADASDAKEAQADADLAKELAELKDTLDRLVTANRTSLYVRIKHLGKSYIARGWVTVEELEDLDKMHEAYHRDLGGNGFLDNLMEAVHALPIRAE